MRSGSRIFAALGVFGVLAATFLSIAFGDKRAAQGAGILGFFAIACLYLAYMLGKQGSIETDGFVPAPADPGEHGEPGEIHLPGPSWYPALYSVAAGALVLGLALNYYVLWAGIVGIVLVTIGWAVESVHEYRREIAHGAHESGDEADPRAVDAAHRVQAFAREHGESDAVVQHLGRGRAEIVLVGHDGSWGTVAVADYAAAESAVALAGVTRHESWPTAVANRIGADNDLWVRMAGAPAAKSPGKPHGPVDGSMQTGARVFLALGIFGVIAAAGFTAGWHSKKAWQGGGILMFFAIACTYLFVALRGARGLESDYPYADERGITREPTEPDPPVDLATLHLPGPSWWPAGYALAAGALLFGLVFNYRLLWAGIVLIVLCSVGWGIESVREYRAALGHHEAAPGSH